MTTNLTYLLKIGLCLVNQISPTLHKRCHYLMTPQHQIITSPCSTILTNFEKLDVSYIYFHNMRNANIILLGSLQQKIFKIILQEGGNTLEIVSLWEVIRNSKQFSIFASSRNGLQELTNWYFVTRGSFGLTFFSPACHMLLIFKLHFLIIHLDLYLPEFNDQPCNLLSLANMGILINQVPFSLVFFPIFFSSLIPLVTL